jgi:hypothetical protein
VLLSYSGEAVDFEGAVHGGGGNEARVVPEPVNKILQLVSKNQCCGSDADPAFHFDGNPEPDPAIILMLIQLPNKARNLENCSNWLIFHKFWLL